MWPASRPSGLHCRKTTSLWRASLYRKGLLHQTRIFCASAVKRQDKPAPTETEPVEAIPYGKLSIGVPTEVRSGERRVAVTPQNAALLLKKGFKEVLVEHGAGFQAQVSCASMHILLQS